MIHDYDIEVPIGAGSMATVFRARQRSVNRVVALKRVRVADAALVERLRHEAAVLATLDHPHIVRIHDVIADGDGVAIAMQYAPGGSLADRLARDGPLSPVDVATMGAAVADALAWAHRRGVRHRDVKPANILFTASGEPLLSDFGIARVDGGPPAGEDGVMGTAEYLDPAVTAGAVADERSDVYGLGAACSEALGPVPAPAALADVIERATAREPGDRFSTGAELATAFRRAATSLDGRVVLALTPADSGTRHFGGSRPPRPARQLPARPAVSRPRPPVGPLIAGGVAVAVVAVAVVAGGVGRRDGSHPRLVASRATTAKATTTPSTNPSTTPSTVVTTTTTSAPIPPCGPAPAAPPGGSLLAGDVEGRGCRTYVTWAGGVMMVAGASPARYRLGRAGDLALLGDWDCDGRATPALYRPDTGEVFLFDGFAAAGELRSRPAIDSGRVRGRPVVVDATCDRIEVRDPA
ncbi:MAG: serine/threonine protein kinase [Acidimicrobiales bacterium]|jgi:serine/threonine protein kinase|nr:serine/threonine protein kinase [Acidimicrobiales bacterium]